MWNQARLTVYITTALSALAGLLALYNFATFDLTTGLVDLAPFSIYALAPVIAGFISSVLAAVALIFKWGGK